MTTQVEFVDRYKNTVHIEICNGPHGIAMELNSYSAPGSLDEHLAVGKDATIELARAIIKEFPESFV